MRPLWKAHRGKTTEGMLLLIFPLVAVDARTEHGVDVTHHGGVVPPGQRRRLVLPPSEGREGVVVKLLRLLLLQLLLLLLLVWVRVRGGGAVDDAVAADLTRQRLGRKTVFGRGMSLQKVRIMFFGHFMNPFAICFFLVDVDITYQPHQPHHMSHCLTGTIQIM